MKLSSQIIRWIRDYTEKANKTSLIIGVSGGVDSGLVSTLCAMTTLPTHCALLPCHSRPEELKRAANHVAWLRRNYAKVQGHCMNLSDTYTALVKEAEHCGPSNELANANTKSRLRMVALYHLAGLHNGLVVGTGNKVEDFGIGFFTKYGDGGVDISPIGSLTKTEVRAMTRELGILPEITNAVPTDGLWPDARTDEQAIGASYEELEWAMDYREEVLASDEGLTDRQKEVLAIYDKRHNSSHHKMNTPPIFQRR